MEDGADTPESKGFFYAPMAKDPAFLFYSQDFFTGSATLSFEDKGKYIHLLCLMHQQGRMDEETIRFTVGSVSVKLKSKFKIDENGLWYNHRLEKEAEKRNKFTKSRVDNGLKGGRPKKEKTDRFPVGSAKHNRMGNENENENNTVVNQTLLYTNEAEKKEFNTMPTPADFNGLPEIHLNNTIQQLKIQRQIDLPPDKVIGMWEVFKVQQLTGTKYQPNKEAVYTYFSNWIKDKKFENGTNNTNTPTNRFTAGQEKLLAKGKQVYSDITGKQGN